MPRTTDDENASAHDSLLYAQAEHEKYGINLPRSSKPAKGTLPLRPRHPDEPSTSDEASVPSRRNSDISFTGTSHRLPHKSNSKTMSKPVLFYGKANQLPSVLTYCKVKALADGTEITAAQLATLFRGPALDWLTQRMSVKSDLLNDFDTFENEVQEAFGLDNKAQEAQAARKLTSCSQKTSVQEYALRFRPLAADANIPDSTAVALFTKGLKQHIRQALIISDDRETLNEAVEEAQRLDGQLYYAKGSGSNRPNKAGRGGRGGKRGGFKRESTRDNYDY